MATVAAKSLYEALYECLKAIRLPSGNTAREGDLARESELKGTEEGLVANGKLRLIGYVRRDGENG